MPRKLRNHTCIQCKCTFESRAKSPFYCRSCACYPRNQREFRSDGRGSGRKDRSWRCEYDPDGDFKGFVFSELEKRAMVQLRTLSPGAVLVSVNGERVVFTQPVQIQ